jgi:hypothetical protein
MIQDVTPGKVAVSAVLVGTGEGGLFTEESKEGSWGKANIKK